MVAQGAFSAYKTKLLKQIGGWQNCVGEDIVLTWQLLSQGYETNFAKMQLLLQKFLRHLLVWVVKEKDGLEV